MKARLALIGAVGFFGLAAQTLLFRDFFTVYEGNELGVAVFFCSWLLWVGLGALIARLPGRAAEQAAVHFEFLPLLYLPAYILQVWLIDHARTLAGVADYELFPFFRMLPVSLATNAPIGLLNGLLFTLACRWFSEQTRLPVARVYIAEAAGAFAGGVTITLLLARGVLGEVLFAGSAALVMLAFALCQLTRRSWIGSLAALVAIAVLLASGLAPRWTQARNRTVWQRIMPDAAYRGSFTTPQAKYLYGEHRGQFNVVAWNSVADNIPDTEHASQILAVLLAQHPAANRLLVLGADGYSICRRLTDLPQASRIVWLPPDPDYPRHLLAALPASLQPPPGRIDCPGVDPLRYLAQQTNTFDLAIINLPDVTSLAANRYCTRNFFQLLRQRLAPGGMLGLRVAGGENVMGGELANVGASAYRTLSTVFPNLAIKPGDETWLMASADHPFTEQPIELRDRFRAITGASEIYPPDGLLSLYLPDRAAFQRQRYEAAMQADHNGLLLNTERHPRALLHSLLFAARRGGADNRLAPLVYALSRTGFALALLLLMLYALLRLVYLLKTAPKPLRRGNVFDSYFLVFSTGAVGMSFGILLMFMFQSVYGSLYLYMGLVSALFMLGLALGSLFAERLLVAGGWSPHRLAGLVLPIHGVLLTLILLLPTACSTATYGALFLVAGLFGGAYVPAAAATLKAGNIPDRTAGGWIALGDHLGGALGGMLAGLIMLPLFGTGQTLALLIAALGTNLVALALPRRNASGARAPVRPVGYSLFGVAVFLLAASLLLRSVLSEGDETRLASIAATMAPGAKLEPRTAALPSGRNLNYLAVLGNDGAPRAWIFPTGALAPGISGYGGPIDLAVAINTNGTLQAVASIRSNETPAYMNRIRPWLAGLAAHDIFGANALEDVDTVSGATITSSAILNTLRESGSLFAVQILARDTGATASAPARRRPSASSVTLVAFTLLALVLRAKPGAVRRRLFLLCGVIVLGFGLNLQYSLAQLFALAGLHLPPSGWSAAFLLTAGLPVLILLTGNIYCGYLCPFGALQELIAGLCPARFRTGTDPTLRRRGRLVKYALLFFLVVLFALGLDPAIATADPLVTVFSRHPRPAALAIGAAVLALSFFHDRFWCRYLCPTGAFLSLLNGVRALRRFLPQLHYGACAYGVTGAHELDCISCDRCRMPGAKKPVRQWRAAWLAVIAAVALIIAGDALLIWRATPFATVQIPAAGSAGIPRNVDMNKLEKLIRQGRLSGREAEYYQPAPPN
ncbi:MAG: 4Fe-4S binding protein [Kiritimatiellaeota bacterium]|nr:4Fe-4S binding protein [Kiritimatiellota bacterium]